MFISPMRLPEVRLDICPPIGVRDNRRLDPFNLVKACIRLTTCVSSQS